MIDRNEEKMKKIGLIVIVIILIILIAIVVKSLLSYKTIVGTVLDITDDRILIVKENSSDDYYSFFNKSLDKEIQVGDVVKLFYLDKRNKIVTDSSLIENIKKIKILGKNIDELENTYFYNSTDKVSILINDFTNERISFTIMDSNKKMYEYSDNYSIHKLYSSEISKRNDIKSESTAITSNSSDIIKKFYDWSEMYGKLESGDYSLDIEMNQWNFGQIRIEFSIDENGEVYYNKVKLLP